MSTLANRLETTEKMCDKEREENRVLRASNIALLAAAKDIRNFLDDLNACPYCKTIFYSRYGVDYQATHSKDCAWRKFQAAIEAAEKEK